MNPASHKHLRTLASLLGLALLAGCAARSGSSAPDRDAGPAAGPRKPKVVWKPSEHFRKASRTPADIDTIVIHTTEGNYDDKLSFVENHNRTWIGNVKYLQKNDRGVSASFVVGRNGEIAQLVAEKDVAFTSTYYNDRSFGIEIAGWGDRKEMWTPGLLNGLADLVAYLCVRWGVEPVHAEGDAIRGPFQTLTKGGVSFPGYAGTGIVGHYQIQTPGSEAVKIGKYGSKSDPGPHFPWDDFIRSVRERIARAGAKPRI